MYDSQTIESSARPVTLGEIFSSECDSETAPQAYEAGRLGSFAKSLEQQSLEKRQRSRARRYDRRRAASMILKHKQFRRIRTCGIPVGSGVDIYRHNTGSCTYHGIETCSSVWSCAVCAARIAERRRKEVNAGLAKARDCGLIPMMLTVTVRHHAGERLVDTLGDVKSGWTRLQQRKAWKGLRAARIFGTITATEVTYGDNGWHPHHHVIMLMRADSEEEARQLIEGVRDDWHDIQAKNGRLLSSAGFQVQGAAAAGDYVAKGSWGAAEEVTLTSQKTGRSEDAGRSMMQLLDDAAAGDTGAASLFREYAEVFKGKRHLVWSKGLREWCGIEDVSDEEAAAAEDVEDPAEHVVRLTRKAYLLVRRHRAEAALLTHIEDGLFVEDFLAELESRPGPGQGPARQSWPRKGSP